MKLGRRGAHLVIGLWLATGVAATPVALGLAGMAHDDALTMRASQAESTRALQPTTDAILAYERPGGLTAEDRTKITVDANRLAALGAVSGPLPAEDGAAAETIVRLDLAGGDWARADTAMAALRSIATGGTDGLTVSIGGPTARAAEAHAAFQGVDRRVLAVSVLLVALVFVVASRSPLWWLLPMASSLVALVAARAAVGLLAGAGALTLDSSSTVLLGVLVLGVAARAGVGWLRRYTGGAAGMAAVVLALLCLRLAQIAEVRDLGTVAAVGVAVAAAVTLTLLPALRVAFEAPFVVRSGRSWLPTRPRTVAVVTAGGLALTALGGFAIQMTGLPDVPAVAGAGSPSASAVGGVDSARAAAILARHFPAGEGGPVIIVTSPRGAFPAHLAAMGTPGLIPAMVTRPQILPLYGFAQATLTSTPDSPQALDTVDRLRTALDAIPGTDALVGGDTATLLDTRAAAVMDRGAVLPPMILALLVVLALAWRSWAAPLIVAAGVALAYGAAVGVTALALHGLDPSLPTLVFALLMASTVDSAAVLLARTRESARTGPVPQAMRLGMASTLGMGTATGLLTVGMGAVLATVPVTGLAQLGVALAIGATLDTFVVRPILVPALVVHIGHRVWPALRLPALPGIRFPRPLRGGA
jgi:RND superfamily putative drug exporter